MKHIKKGYVLFALATMLPLMAGNDSATTTAVVSTESTELFMCQDKQIESKLFEVFTRQNTGVLGKLNADRHLGPVTSESAAAYYMSEKFKTYPDAMNIGIEHHVLVNIFEQYLSAKYTSMHDPILSAMAASFVYFGEIRNQLDARVLLNQDVLQSYNNGLKVTSDTLSRSISEIIENANLTGVLARYNTFLIQLDRKSTLKILNGYASQRKDRWTQAILILKELHNFGQNDENKVVYDPQNGILSMRTLRYEIYLGLLKEFLVAKICHDIVSKTPDVTDPASFADLDSYMRTKLFTGTGAITAFTLAITNDADRAAFYKSIKNMILAYRADANASMLLSDEELKIIQTPKQGNTHVNIGMEECIAYVNRFMKERQDELAQQHEEIRPSLQWGAGYPEFSATIATAHANFTKSTHEYLQRRYMQVGKLLMFCMGVDDSKTAESQRFVQGDIQKLSIVSVKAALDKFMQIKSTNFPEPTNEVTPLFYLALHSTKKYRKWSEITDSTDVKGRKNSIQYLEHKALNHRPGELTNILSENVVNWNIDLLLSSYYNDKNHGLGRFVWKLITRRLVGVVKLAAQKYLPESTYPLLCDLIYAPDMNDHIIALIRTNAQSLVPIIEREKQAKTKGADGTSIETRVADAKRATNVLLTLGYLERAMNCMSTINYEELIASVKDVPGFKFLKSRYQYISQI